MNDFETQTERYGKAMFFIMWLIIIAFLYALFDYWYDQQSNPNQRLESQVDGLGNLEVILKRNRFGAYKVRGEINGVAVNFLVDTGASTVAVPAGLARQMNLPRGRALNVLTAGGTVKAYATQLSSLSIGPIYLEDVPGTITPTMASNKVLLGMTALKHMTFKQVGNTLILTQPAAVPGT